MFSQIRLTGLRGFDKQWLTWRGILCESRTVSLQRFLLSPIFVQVAFKHQRQRALMFFMMKKPRHGCRGSVVSAAAHCVAKPCIAWIFDHEFGLVSMSMFCRDGLTVSVYVAT